MNYDDHVSNFKYIIENLETYLKNNCQEEKLTPFAKLTDSFDINKIIEGDNETLINFAKLLLCISSLSSIKDKHLSNISPLKADIQNEYFSSLELFLQIENNEKQIATFDLNILEDLNLSESLMNDLKDLKNETIEKEKNSEQNNNEENNKDEKIALTLGSSTFGINNKIENEDVNDDYDSNSKAIILDKNSNIINNEKENEKKDEKKDEKDSEQNLKFEQINVDINSIPKELLNVNNLKPIKESLNVYINTPQETTEPESNQINSNIFSNSDTNNNPFIDPDINKNPFADDPSTSKILENPYKSTTKTEKVIVETKTYCNLVKIGKDGIPITTNINPDPNTNININNIPINQISFFLHGGDLLKKKIDILEETILKNSEMYNYASNKYETQIKDKEAEIKNLKNIIENLKNEHKNELENINKEKDNYLNQVSDLSSLKNNNQSEIEKIKNELDNERKKYEDLLNIKNKLENENNENKNMNNIQNTQKDKEISDLKLKLDEINRKFNKLDIENIQLKKNIEELKQQKEKEFSEQQKQLKDISSLKDQEISMLNDKIKILQSNQNDKNMLLEKNFEEYKINSTKMNNDLMNQNNELKMQISEIPTLKQEIEKYKNLYENIDNENAKMHAEMINLQDRLQMGGKLNNDLNQKIRVLETKLKSEPYFAKEIMSKALFEFANKIMREKNN